MERLVSEDNDSQSKQDNKRMGSVATKTDNGQSIPTPVTARSQVVEITTGASAKEKLLLVEVEESQAKRDSSKEEPTSDKTFSKRPPWFTGILGMEDLLAVDQYRSKFLKDLSEMTSKRDAIMTDNTLSFEERKSKVTALTLGADRDRLEGMM